MSREPNHDLIFNDDMLQITRLAALTHDIGHFPFSHNLEGSFDWLKENGNISRSYTHEDFSIRILDMPVL